MYTYTYTPHVYSTYIKAMAYKTVVKESQWNIDSAFTYHPLHLPLPLPRLLPPHPLLPPHLLLLHPLPC